MVVFGYFEDDLHILTCLYQLKNDGKIWFIIHKTMVIDFKDELIWSIWLGNYRILGHVKSTSKEHAY